MDFYKYIGFEHYPSILEQDKEHKNLHKFLLGIDNLFHSKSSLELGKYIDSLRNPKLLELDKLHNYLHTNLFHKHIDFRPKQILVEDKYIYFDWNPMFLVMDKPHIVVHKIPLDINIEMFVCSKLSLVEDNSKC